MITKFGKVTIEENKINIEGFTFEGVDRTEAMLLAVRWAIDALEDELTGLLDDLEQLRGDFSENERSS